MDCMEKLCRFCLEVSDTKLCSLEESDILYSIQKCLTIKISTDDSFPSKLCKECFKKILIITKFCLSVKENEDKLQYYSKNGLLQDFYSKISCNMHIKDEQKELKMNIPEKVEDDTSTYFEDYDNLINEEFSDHIDKAHCSSDDDITLSAIKKEKEINTVAPIKKITIFRPLKSLSNSKRKKKKEPENIEYIKPFNCLSCTKEFNSQADLTKHYYAEHYQKKVAGNNYTKHKSEDKTIYYSCNSCENTFNLKKDIVKHVKSHTNDRDERPLICKLCARTYRTVPEIVRHARAHNGLKLECPYNCGFTTAYQGAMKEHKNRHLDEYKYTCQTCSKGFNIKTWYEQHQNIHTGVKPFICNICDVAFSLSRYLQTHKSSMHPQMSSLKRYRCVHCDEKCGSAKSLAIHLQEHGINKATDFLCDFCGKILTTAYQLEYHHRMHLGVKPYSCTICKKKFAKKYNVQLHMNTHTGDKLHSCSHCGKRYSQRCTLLKHLKRYHGSGGRSSLHRTEATQESG